MAEGKGRAESAVVSIEAFEARIRTRTSRVGVIGLGYVGLPLACAAAAAGFTVLGFDIDGPKVEGLNQGQSPLKHIPSAPIRRLLEQGRFSATGDFSQIAEVEVILICVPTPLTRHREPDLGYVERTVETIRPHLQPDQLLILESTTYPGTTTELIRPLIAAAGFRPGENLFLAYSPEREDPGNAEFDTARIPKVVGGDGETALRLALAFYDQFVARTVPVSSTATAEAVKLTENIFRAVNIALVNELKVVYGAMGIDIWEVIEAAKSKPFGYMPFYPGPGLGGHCIPIDPFYLTWKARAYGISTRFIELAGEVNTAMPHLVVERLRDALDQRFEKPLSGASILVLGVAYKKNIDDIRESPALRVHPKRS
jgi:UDP-N-acetyl-D-glucosamine dehydrogenase